MEVARAGKKITILANGSRASIIPFPVKHDDKTGFGFVLEMDGKRIGYTSDTEYYAGISRHYSGCDLLIVNNLKPKIDSIPGHLHSAATSRLLSEARPKLAVLTHMGISLLAAGPGREARKIEKKSGVRAISAKDGMKITI